MKTMLTLLSIICCVRLVVAQESSGSKESFIPEHFTLLHEASGDLNKDSLADVAMVIQYAGETLENERQRSLIILFKDKKTKLFTRAAKADHVILQQDQGGTFSDPFSGMEIKNNVLRIDFDGGSREKWSTTHRYRYTGNAYFRVIGATYEVEDNGVTKTYDYNLSNGNIVNTVRDSRNKANNKTTSRKLQLMPIEISEFEPDAIWAHLLPDFYKKTEVCTLQGAGLGDCFHVNFNCGDFGNAKIFLDQAGFSLWDDLTVEGSHGESVANPKYRGKKFEITYITNEGVQCEPQGVDVYQLVIGFKVLPTTTSSAPATLPADGLFAYLDFDVDVWDRSINNREVNLHGGQHVSDGTNPVGAYHLSDHSYIDISKTGQNFSIPLTISAWFQTDQPQGELQTIVSMGRSKDGTGFNFGYGFPGKTNSVYFGLIGSTPFGIEYELETKGRHFVAVTLDVKSISLYVDGNFVAEKYLVPSEVTLIQQNLMNSTQSIEIGRELSTLDRYFTGTIDNIAIYNRALASDEIIRVWTATKAGSQVAR